jgi:hypothetical protein
MKTEFVTSARQRGLLRGRIEHPQQHMSHLSSRLDGRMPGLSEVCSFHGDSPPNPPPSETKELVSMVTTGSNRSQAAFVGGLVGAEGGVLKSVAHTVRVPPGLERIQPASRPAEGRFPQGSAKCPDPPTFIDEVALTFLPHGDDQLQTPCGAAPRPSRPRHTSRVLLRDAQDSLRLGRVLGVADVLPDPLSERPTPGVGLGGPYGCWTSPRRSRLLLDEGRAICVGAGNLRPSLRSVGEASRIREGYGRRESGGRQVGGRGRARGFDSRQPGEPRWRTDLNGTA